LAKADFKREVLPLRNVFGKLPGMDGRGNLPSVGMSFFDVFMKD
jgi:hypothetical protein